jgi:protein-S-isoprenylcysteine O-methyltransferase Ste14
MNFASITLAVAALVWLSTEAFLIARDRSSGKGTVTKDSRTRYLNAIATLLAIGIPIAFSFFPSLRVASIEGEQVVWAGIAIMLAGFVLRHWSIMILGKYFRTTIELEAIHKVVQTGPYKYIRHPSYSGIILFFVGYSLAAGNWISLIVAILLPTAALLHRIRIEEVALVQGMGDEYREYQKKTKKLIPLIW